MPPGIAREEGGGKEGMEEKLKMLSEVNTRTASRGQNELICKFKIVAGDVISINNVSNGG